MDDFIKLSFIDGKLPKFNTYLRNPSMSVSQLHSQIVFCIFQQRNLQADDVRLFWIDEDGDQIDILDQQDYDIFRLKCVKKRQVCVERAKKIEKESTTSHSGIIGTEAAVHDKVQCDECNVVPIVGFRYKCLECENFDLCAKCEAKCLHSHHLMLRISSPLHGYWWAVKDFRKHSKRCGAAVNSEDSTSATCSGGSRRYHRKHGHAHANRNSSGIFSNLCEMMQHLAEGGAEGVYSSGDRQQPTKTPPPTPPEERDNTTGVCPPKTPPPTPTNINLSEMQSAQNFKPETKSKEATTNTSPKMATTGQSTSQMGSPIFENVQQFVDPQFMKAGIEILSNFSEMFSKMLEPVDGSGGYKADSTSAGYGGRCPFDPTLFNKINPNTQSHSKSQSTSTSTDTGNEMSSFIISNAIKKAASEAAQTAAQAASEAAQTAAQAAVEASVHAAKAAAEMTVPQPNKIANGKAQEATAENCNTRHVSQDADGDWQMIDKATPSVSVHDLSGSVSSVSIISTEPSTSNASNGVDYEKLSHNLRQHLENEKKTIKKDDAAVDGTAEIPSFSPPVSVPAVALPSVATPSVATPSVATPSVATPSVATPSVATPLVAAPSVASSSASSSSSARLNEEKRAIPVYHKEQRINNAVIAMMAMGFSNEGGWLTQLLESVNGSIPDALDEMSAAQRNRN